GFRYGVRILEKESEVRVRLPTTPPAKAGIGILFGGAFSATFVVAFGVGMPPSVTAMVVVWSIVLGSAGLGYLILAARVASGKADLVIDRFQRTLTLPQTFGRKEPVVVPMADLVAIEAVTVEKQASEGTIRQYVPTVRWRDAGGDLQEGKLAEWDDER